MIIQILLSQKSTYRVDEGWRGRRGRRILADSSFCTNLLAGNLAGDELLSTRMPANTDLHTYNIHGPSRAAGAATHPIQTVRAHVSLPQRSSTTILDRAGKARRQHCPSSPAVGVIYQSRRASYTSINNQRSGVCRCWPESMEQSTSCCPLLCHIQHLQKDLKSHLFGLSFLV